MNITRGIIAALIWALVGALAPILIVGTYTILSWQINNTAEFDRQYDISWWRTRATWPLVGASIYLGLTAWATYTPKRDFGFGKTLASSSPRPCC